MRSRTPSTKFAYSIEEAAELLSVRRDSIYDLIQAQKLGSFKIGTRRLVAHRQLEVFIESATGLDLADQNDPATKEGSLPS
jgi:excisionase family DNA binding protein